MTTPTAVGQFQQCPVGGLVGNNAVWNGVPGGAAGVTFYNQDANNTVYLGYVPNIAVNGANTFPLGPTQSISLDGSRTVYAVAPSGTANLVVAPGVTNFFQRPSLPLLGGAKVFVQATAPTAPPPIPLNSLWLNTTLGALETWNGSAWVVQSFTGTQLITAGTIAANLLVAGIVVAGIVNGTTIIGSELKLQNSFGAVIVDLSAAKQALFIYADTGSATQGAMQVSVAGKAGVDPFTAQSYAAGTNYYVTISGVTYGAGINQATLNQVGFAINDIANPANQAMGLFGVASNGAVHRAGYTLSTGKVTATDVDAQITAASAVVSATTNGIINLLAGAVDLGVNGTLQVQDSARQLLISGATQSDTLNIDSLGMVRNVPSTDGTTYCGTGVNTGVVSGQLINSTSPAVIGTFTWQVATGITYRLNMTLFYHGGQAAGAPVIGFDGGSVSSALNGWNSWYTAGAVFSTGGYISSGGNQTGPTLATSNFMLREEILVQFSTGGSFNVRAQEGTAGDTWTIDHGWAELRPC